MFGRTDGGRQFPAGYGRQMGRIEIGLNPAADFELFFDQISFPFSLERQACALDGPMHQHTDQHHRQHAAGNNEIKLYPRLQKGDGSNAAVGQRSDQDGRPEPHGRQIDKSGKGDRDKRQHDHKTGNRWGRCEKGFRQDRMQGTGVHPT